MKVIIYSTPTCVYCKAVKEFLSENNIEFEEYDVSENYEKAREMVIKSGQMGVPVIDINGEIIIGYNRKKIADKLNIKI